jgi:hypothetical protein
MGCVINDGATTQPLSIFRFVIVPVAGTGAEIVISSTAIRWHPDLLEEINAPFMEVFSPLPGFLSLFY